MSHNLNFHAQDNFLATTSRQEKGYVQSDGATANRRIEWTLGAAGNVAGSDLSEVGHVFRVPTSNLANVLPIFIYSDSQTSGIDVAGPLITAMTISTTLEIQFRSNTDAANRIILSTTGFAARYSGKIVRLDAVITAGASDPILYVDGVQWTSWAAPTTVGTVPPWMSTGLGYTYRACFYNWPSLDFTPGFPINRALSASEIRQMIDSGEESASDGLGGSMIDSNTSSFTNRGAVTNDLAIPTNGFEFFSGASPNGFSAQHSGTNGSLSQASKLGFVNSFAGTRWRVRFDLSVSVGAKPNFIGLTVSGASGFIDASENLSPQVIVGSNDLIVTATANFGGFSFLCLSSQATNSFTVSNFSLIPLGSLIQPVFQPGPVIADSGPNGISGVCIGMNQVAHNSIWGEVSGQATWAGTHEAKRIFATATPYLPQNAVITSITTKATAASTGSGLTIGTTNSNNRYVTLNAYTTAAKSHALANRLPSGITANELDIVIDPDTANYTGTIQITIKYYVSSPL
jgi:hypothetical protein